MKDLTGEEFTGSIQAREWLGKNKKQVDAAIKDVKVKAKAQAEEAKANK